MPLIVEDGTGRSDAESYASVATALAYFGGISSVEGAAFIAASTTRQEQGLRAATSWLDAQFGHRYQGMRIGNTQRLDFPRFGIEVDGLSLPYSPLPRHLVEACCEAAARDVVGGDQALIPDVTPDDQITKKSVSVGPISKSVEWGDGMGMAGGGSQTYFAKIEGLLRRLLSPVGLTRI